MGKIKMEFSDQRHGNMSFFNGNSIDVIRNRQLFAIDRGFSLFDPRKFPCNGFSPSLAHGEKIIRIEQENVANIRGIGILEKSTRVCDAIITDVPNFTILVPFSDCPPVVFFDEVKHIMAVIHSGRLGTLLGLSQKTFEEMDKHFSCQPQNIIAYLFPGICDKCYIVDKPMTNAPENLRKYIKEINGEYSFDLRGMVLQQIINIGIERVFFPRGKDECTCHTIYEDEPLYYSFYGFKYERCFHKHKGNQLLLAEIIM